MSLPRQILDRVERLYSYHQRSKLMAEPTRPPIAPADLQYKPASFRIFENAPKIPLPTNLLDAPIPMLSLLNAGQDALPDSLRAPPQDLKTLASWLYYAAGETERTTGASRGWMRPFPEADANFPIEIYVAIFAIKDIEPGLYHFSPREFSLRRLREGPTALLQMKKGRPDLDFLKTLPAVILIAGSYWRAVHKHGRRGYRTMLLDAGQMVQNIVTAGAGLGAQTITRLSMNDSTMRDLIGVAPREDLATAESVLAMVAWADRAVAPIVIPPGATAGKMTAIERTPLSNKVATDSASLEPLLMHVDCTAPGVAVREIRPPLTELSPMPAKHPFSHVRADDEIQRSLPVRQVLLERRIAQRFSRQAITRSQLLAINRAAFRGGSFFPMFPDGPHVACLRPFWIVNEVTGLDRGIWYYHPPSDGWSLLSANQFRRECKHIANERDLFGQAAAVCVMTANLHLLMTQGGPDAYRLAHLEAGIATQRIYCAAVSMELGCANSHDFCDEECRIFLGLSRTGWEVLSLAGIGKAARQEESEAQVKLKPLGEAGLWNG